MSSIHHGLISAQLAHLAEGVECVVVLSICNDYVLAIELRIPCITQYKCSVEQILWRRELDNEQPARTQRRGCGCEALNGVIV